MDEEGITEEEVRIEPRLHDRWSLLALTVAFVDDVADLIHEYTGMTSVMTAEHILQKRNDKKFRRIVDGYSDQRTGPVQSED